MIALVRLLLAIFFSPLRSMARREAENAVLRHQVVVLRRQARGRIRLTSGDRLFFVWLYRLCPSALNAIAIIQPGTILRWHRAGFRLYWRWRSRARGGRPKIDQELRALIREISVANPLWGAPRIHGELLKLGFTVAQSTVAKYMAKHRRPPSQSWNTFLRNHLSATASIDLFVVPTATFKLLYGMVILHHERRRLVSFGVTSNPTAEWMARQIAEAFPWEEAPPLPDPRSGSRLWSSLRSTTSRHGHSGSSDSATITVAKSICRTAHRFHPARMPRPYNRDRRGSSAPRPKIVRALLQRGTDAPIPGQRCTE